MKCRFFSNQHEWSFVGDDLGSSKEFRSFYVCLICHEATSVAWGSFDYKNQLIGGPCIVPEHACEYCKDHHTYLGDV